MAFAGNRVPLKNLDLETSSDPVNTVGLVAGPGVPTRSLYLDGTLVGGNVDTPTLQEVTDTGNVTSNVVQFTGEPVSMKVSGDIDTTSNVVIGPKETIFGGVRYRVAINRGAGEVG